ncbi:MAG: BspA family leucine-rich repeat surface protein [Allobaculum sp.]|nr:BspA family leucine-rich repeat surface protein [Allobaculum sp.]
MKNTILCSGTIGTVPWTLDEKGTLIIGASIEKTDVDLEIPWWEYSVSHKILRISIIGKSPFVAMGSCHRLFGDLPYVKSIDLSGWDTSLVTDMAEMFSWCYKLETLNLSKLNPSSVTNMKGMFSGCHNLKNLNLSMWDTSSVTEMSKMFNVCGLL